MPSNLIPTNENIFGDLEGQFARPSEGMTDWARGAADTFDQKADVANKSYNQSFGSNMADIEKIKSTIADYKNADQYVAQTNEQVKNLVAKEYGGMGVRMAFDPLAETQSKEQKMSLAANLSQISSQLATQNLQKSVSRYGFDLDVYKGYQSIIENDRRFYQSLRLDQEEFENKVKMQEAQMDADRLGSILGAIGTVGGFAAGIALAPATGGASLLAAGALGAGAGGAMGKAAGGKIGGK
jgi:hypothetical protein